MASFLDKTGLARVWAKAKAMFVYKVGTASGSGNVVTGLSISNGVITPEKGITAIHSGNIGEQEVSTAKNINNGSPVLATAYERNSIYIVQPSYSTDMPVKKLCFDWYGNYWAFGNIRSNSTPSKGLGVYFQDTEVGRFTTSGWSGAAGSVPFSGITSKPTTLAGYGITDAKISNGTITLGSSSITPVTSSQLPTAIPDSVINALS